MKERTYRFMTEPPLFPFGYGLSYTKFSIGNANISTTLVKYGESVAISIPITNMGKKDGTEVVQVYLRKVNDTNGLTKTLRGFQRIDVAKGKTEKAVIDLAYSAFEFYDDKALQVKVTPGDYEVWYGSSSDVKDLKMVKVSVQ
jgi:beta-glucosidase